MSSTMLLPGEEKPLTDPAEIEQRLGHEIEAIVAAGPVGIEATSVIDLTAGHPEILRVGRGDVSAFV
jgi:tRNA A37 threonylcarbamoyladenosine synthetase subunit TsaC/SUA5/YrdC